MRYTDPRTRSLTHKVLDVFLYVCLLWLAILGLSVYRAQKKYTVYFFLLIPVSVSATVPTGDLMGDKAWFPAKCNVRRAYRAQRNQRKDRKTVPASI